MPAPDSTWIVPQWPAPARVRAVFTTRHGGVSQGCWHSLNLGTHVGDDPAHVAANRGRLAAALGREPRYLNQVHGREVLSLPAEPPRPGAAPPVADACLTRAPGVVATILVADCLPVLLTDRDGSFVAAAHAGWRGLAGGPAPGVPGVLEAVFSACFDAQANENQPRAASEIIAWLGPCIGPSAFEVGDEVRAAFLAFDERARQAFVPAGRGGKWLADLPLLARQRLERLGVSQVHGNDGTPGWCTAGDASRFFSHRRDAVRLGSSGRMAACVWLTGA
jgi:YfiH family protein